LLVHDAPVVFDEKKKGIECLGSQGDKLPMLKQKALFGINPK